MKNTNFWIVAIAIIGCVWLISGFICRNVYCDSCENLDKLGYSYTILHITSFVLLFLALVLMYKVHKQDYQGRQKKKEYERKKELESLQYDLFLKKKQTTDDADKVLKIKIEDILNEKLKEKKSDYKNDLKRLQSDMDLYDSIRKIVEGKPEAEDNGENGHDIQ